MAGERVPLQTEEECMPPVTLLVTLISSAGAPDSHLRTEILDDDQLLALFEERAAKAVAAAGPNDPRAREQGRRYMVGPRQYTMVQYSTEQYICSTVQYHVPVQYHTEHP
jgi:hypothetical protein